MRIWLFGVALCGATALAETEIWRCDGTLTNLPKPGMNCIHYRTGVPYRPQPGTAMLEWRCGKALTDRPLRGCVNVRTGEVWDEAPPLPAAGGLLSPAGEGETLEAEQVVELGQIISRYYRGRGVKLDDQQLAAKIGLVAGCVDALDDAGGFSEREKIAFCLGRSDGG